MLLHCSGCDHEWLSIYDFELCDWCGKESYRLVGETVMEQFTEDMCRKRNRAAKKRGISKKPIKSLRKKSQPSYSAEMLARARERSSTTMASTSTASFRFGAEPAMAAPAPPRRNIYQSDSMAGSYPEILSAISDDRVE